MSSPIIFWLVVILGFIVSFVLKWPLGICAMRGSMFDYVTDGCNIYSEILYPFLFCFDIISLTLCLALRSRKMAKITLCSSYICIALSFLLIENYTVSIEEATRKMQEVQSKRNNDETANMEDKANFN